MPCARGPRYRSPDPVDLHAMARVAGEDVSRADKRSARFGRLWDGRHVTLCNNHCPGGDELWTGGQAAGGRHAVGSQT